MAGRRELGFPKGNATNLKEQMAKTTLRSVRALGHTYVELREDGKKSIFFCTLCLAPCYSDKVLFDHLKGNLHTQRLAAAKITLLASNPWPFNDGVLFFDISREEYRQLKISNANQSGLLDIQNGNNNLSIVKHSVTGDKNLDSVDVELRSEVDVGDKNVNSYAGDYDLVIPGVLLMDDISDIGVKFIGLGQIAARLREKDGVSNEICRMWCEWLGDKNPADEDTFLVPEHDFGIVTFIYNQDLGRMGLLDDLKTLLSTGSLEETENAEGIARKRKKSFSDPEDISDSLGNQYDSSGEESPEANSSNPRLLLDDQFLHRRFISNKSIRRELRRQQRVAAEKMCAICQHKMLPGKDVATILNLKTGRLACTSRNVHGAFHVFHTSCLIHWILLCEYEVLVNQPVSPKVKKRSRKKTTGKSNENDKEIRPVTQIHSIFCPECHGTGTVNEGEEYEKPKFLLSQIFRFKIKLSDAHRAWMKSPEVLQNCSTGFYFPPQSEETVQEKVSPLKLMHFYSADA